MRRDPIPVAEIQADRGERGAAIILALLVALILVFLGMGLLLLGIPEMAIFIAIAILGKAGFTYLKSTLFALLNRAAPIDTVSKNRYRIGLVLFCLPLLMGWLAPYVSDLIPRYGDYHIALAIAGDGLLVLGLFVLGGEFWDKLRALFVHRATARFPQETDV